MLDYLVGSMVSANAAAPATSPIAPRPPPPRVFHPSPPPAPRPAARHAAVAPPVLGPGFRIRPVTAANMEYAIASLRTTYPYITIDTEYADGAVHRPPAACLAPRPRERYALVKADVDDVPIVQLGITLCDQHGNIPLAGATDGHGGRPSELAWEVTFSDFDDARRPESVAFLWSQVIDIESE